MKWLALCTLAIGMLTFFPTAALLAHDGGVSYEEKIGAYIVDVGYSSEAPVSGERLVFDFALSRAADERAETFEKVWVRLSHEEQALFATSIARQELGPTTLLFSVPQELVGKLSVFVRYEGTDGVLAETTFPLVIEAGPQSNGQGAFPFAATAAGAVGILLGGVGMWIVGRRRMVQ